MARGINKVMLLGYLGGDPVVRVSQQGMTISNFQLATGESWKNKKTGETEKKTEWHKIVIINKLAEICRDYLKKGSRVYVEGKIRTRKWNDKQGNEIYTTEIICTELQMLDTKSNDENISYNHKEKEDYMPSSTPPTASENAKYHDDDIPF